MKPAGSKNEESVRLVRLAPYLALFVSVASRLGARARRLLCLRGTSFFVPLYTRYKEIFSCECEESHHSQALGHKISGLEDVERTSCLRLASWHRDRAFSDPARILRSIRWRTPSATQVDALWRAAAARDDATSAESV